MILLYVCGYFVLVVISLRLIHCGGLRDLWFTWFAFASGCFDLSCVLTFWVYTSGVLLLAWVGLV